MSLPVLTDIQTHGYNSKNALLTQEGLKREHSPNSRGKVKKIKYIKLQCTLKKVRRLKSFLLKININLFEKKIWA